MAGNTLIIISGNMFIRDGRTKIIGDEWAHNNDLFTKICCDTITGLYIHKQIPFTKFLNCLSRIRYKGQDLQTRGDFSPVFVNLEGAWFGNKKVLGFENYELDIQKLEVEWNKFWENLK